MDNQIIRSNCRCGRERRNKESNWSGLMLFVVQLKQHDVICSTAKTT